MPTSDIHRNDAVDAGDGGDRRSQGEEDAMGMTKEKWMGIAVLCTLRQLVGAEGVCRLVCETKGVDKEGGKSTIHYGKLRKRQAAMQRCICNSSAHRSANTWPNG